MSMTIAGLHHDRRPCARLVLIALLLGLAAGCDAREVAPPVTPVMLPVAPVTSVADVAPARTREPINPRLLRRFSPVANDLPDAPPASAELIELGRMLWYEPRLSQSGAISCNSCHALDAYGVDGLPTSVGDGAQVGRRNAPTVYNLPEHFSLFWDGRARDTVQQALMPILDATEMASSKEHVETFLRSQPVYRDRFARAFPDAPEAVTLEHVAVSLAAFERGLRTHSRWDDYLAGDETALSDVEVRGLRIFLDVGCMTCHTGPEVGASSFQRVGAVEPWPNQSDLGRFQITNDAVDVMFFRVPTLKNVARTAPYFHDGSSATLPDAVRRMAFHQLGIVLEADEVDAVVQLLEAMTGELPRDYIAPPALPGLAGR